MTELQVEFMGEVLAVAAGSSLSFGRDAALVVDGANPYLHRVLGIFVCVDGAWVLQNVGRHTRLTVQPRPVGGTRLDLAPGEQAPLPFGDLVVRFTAGVAQYEVVVVQPQTGDRSVPRPSPSDTVDFGAVEVGHEQRQMLAILGRALLTGEGDWPGDMPSNRAVAEELGWTRSKFNRKLDHLCRRLSAQGVPGVVAGPDGIASARRRLLVEHFVLRGAVTVDDLPASSSTSSSASSSRR